MRCLGAAASQTPNGPSLPSFPGRLAGSFPALAGDNPGGLLPGLGLGQVGAAEGSGSGPLGLELWNKLASLPGPFLTFASE
jgi:hypothetical protein